MANNDNRNVLCGGEGRQGNSIWSDVERAQFEQGVIAHGWGSWATMARHVVPSRDRKQVKSHAQKFQLNHPADYRRLLREHEARLVSSPAVAAGSGKVGGGTNIKVKVHRKTPPPRKKRGGAKAETQAVRTSPRLRFSAPVANIGSKSDAAVSPKRYGTLDGSGNTASASAMKSATAAGSPRKEITSMPPLPYPKAILFSTVINGAGLATVDDATPASTSSKSYNIELPMLPLPVGVLSDSTNDKRHTTLGRSALASSTSVSFFDVKCPYRPYHPFEMSNHEYPPNPNYDELPASKTTVTPSSGQANVKSMYESSMSLSAFDFNIHDCDVGMNTDDFDDFVASHAARDVIGRACNEEMIDPLYQLELEDHKLDIMTEFPEPSCNVLFDRAIKGEMLPQRDDSRKLFAAASNGIGLVDLIMTSGGSEALQIPPNVRPDQRLFMQLRSFLISPPDVTDPKENIVVCAGRGAGYLCRARIKKELGEHLSMCWWREDVFDNHSRVIRSSGKVAEGDPIIPKKLALERLVALIAVMLDVDHWHALRDGTTSTATDNTVADDDDDIRHVGQLLSGLWERVSRSLHRDGFVLLGGDFIERTERNEAINTLVARLDLISRQDIIQSRRVSP